MTDKRLERAIADTLSDLVPMHDTDYIEDVLARTARTRQRPAWTFPGRYLTMARTPALATISVLALGVGLGVMFAAHGRTTPNHRPGGPRGPTPSASQPATVHFAGAQAVTDRPRGLRTKIAYEWFSRRGRSPIPSNHQGGQARRQQRPRRRARAARKQ